MRPLAVLLAALALVSGAPFVTPAAYAAPPAVTYAPPVDGATVDLFRPPSTPYGPGNRGVDYATAPGTAVRTAAPGEVVFAGVVGFTRHVVVLHADGLRTSYSFLQRVTVRRGDRLPAGAVVGIAGAAFHFGVRAGDAYLDPLALFGGPDRVHLVPDAERVPLPEAAERTGLGQSLRGFLGSVTTASRGAVEWASGKVDAGLQRAGDGAALAARYLRDQATAIVDEWMQELRTWIHYASVLSPAGMVAGTFEVAMDAWQAAHRLCTPDDEPPPPPRPGRRLAVLVAGLGSSSDPAQASVTDVDTAALGYAPGDVKQFSYRGGTTEENDYDALDTLGDLGTSGKRLALLLARLARNNPGVPIDIVAHSQGGVVTRAALAYHVKHKLPGGPQLGTVITLASPHQGADLATAGFLLGRTKWGHNIQEVIGESGISPIDPRATSVRQLAETSSFMRRLKRQEMPAGVRFVSIAATNDVVVPSQRSELEGADNILVRLAGTSPLTNHSDLPGSPEAHREMALALAGQPPTCTSFLESFRGGMAGYGISYAEDAIGGGLSALFLRFGGHQGLPSFKKPPPTHKLPWWSRRRASTPRKDQ